MELDGALFFGSAERLSDEVDAAMDAAFAGGLEVSALHNHFFHDEPKVFFMHIGGQGESEKLAGAVKTVWDAIKKVRAGRAEPATRFGGRFPRRGPLTPR